MRPRERYLVHGPDELDPVALLTLVLGTGAAGHSAPDISRQLLQRFGGLSGLRAAPPAALARVPGVGPARAVRLHAALALSQRTDAPSPTEPVTTPEAAAALLAPRLRGLAQEELHALYLDRRGRVRHQRRLTRGTDHCTLVDPRQILQPAVQLGVPRIVLAHNHPSGDPNPSEADLRTTRRVVAAAHTLRLQLVDHLILTDDAHTSLAALGAIPEPAAGTSLLADPLSPCG